VRWRTATQGTGIGRWEQAVTQYAEGRQLAKDSGDDRHWSALTASVNIVHLLKANHQSALEEYEALRVVGEHANDRQTIAWAAGGAARVYFRTGEMALMQTHTQRAYEMLDACTVANQLDIFSQKALIALHNNDEKAAWEHLQRCVPLLHRPTQVTLYTPSMQLAFAALDYWRRSQNSQAQSVVKSALRFSQGFARIFPVGKPASTFLLGLNHHLNGDNKKAVKRWHEAMTAATQLGMPYEQALAGHGLASINELTPQQRGQRDAALEVMGISRPGFPSNLMKAYRDNV